MQDGVECRTSVLLDSNAFVVKDYYERIMTDMVTHHSMGSTHSCHRGPRASHFEVTHVQSPGVLVPMLTSTGSNHYGYGNPRLRHFEVTDGRHPSIQIAMLS